MAPDWQEKQKALSAEQSTLNLLHPPKQATNHPLSALFKLWGRWYDAHVTTIPNLRPQLLLTATTRKAPHMNPEALSCHDLSPPLISKIHPQPNDHNLANSPKATPILTISLATKQTPKQWTIRHKNRKNHRVHRIRMINKRTRLPCPKQPLPRFPITSTKNQLQTKPRHNLKQTCHSFFTIMHQP